MKDSQRRAMYAKKREEMKKEGYKPNPHLTDSGNFNPNAWNDKEAGSIWKNGGAWNEERKRWQFSKFDYPNLYRNYMSLYGNDNKAMSSLGGHFGQALERNDLEDAYSRADSNNEQRLAKVTGKSKAQLWAMVDLAYNGQSYDDAKIKRLKNIIHGKQY